MSPSVAKRTVGRYEIVEELGRGGMATVYLARQTDLDRLVALKELSAFRQTDPAFVRRFLRESRLAGSLSHPNIVTVHDYFENDGTPYIAMEYVERGSLRPYIGHMTLTQVAGVLEEMLSALAYAANHHVVHRDLKPENVMVTSDGRVKIADFGIAKATGNAQTTSVLTGAGTTVGTPNYMAPEQAMGQDLGPQTDLYSVGVMAFEFFVGRVPFSDTEEPMAVLMRQVSDPVPPARSVNPAVDPAISNWIERMLVKDPRGRIQSAGDAWDAFEEIVIGMVGPRWRRSALLVDPPKGPPATPAMPASNPSLARTTMPELPTRKLPRDDTAATLPLRQRRRRGRGGLVTAGLTVLAVLVALAAGLAGHGSGDPPAAATPTANVTTPDLALRVPQGWRPVRKPPYLGLPLTRAAAVSPGGRPGGPIVEFGMVKGDAASNSLLLPQSFVSSLGRPPKHRTARLRTQNLEAWRYGRLRPVGIGRELTVFTVPTSGGVATIACAAAPCDAIARTLRLRTVSAYPIGPSTSYATALNGAVGTLQQATQSGEQNIQSSQTLSGQAAAERALASAYETAAAQLASLNLSPADADANARLLAALQGAARAYRRAAKAAAGGNADAYRSASAAIPQAKAEVNAALAGVQAAGYQSSKPNSKPAPQQPAQSDSGVGDSQSDDPSDDQPEN